MYYEKEFFNYILKYIINIKHFVNMKDKKIQKNFLTFAPEINTKTII